MRTKYLNNKWIQGFSMIVLVMTLTQCGSGTSKKGFVKEPIDILIRDYSTTNNFSIILFDMDYDEASDAYRHQYQILAEPLPPGDTTIVTTTTDWLKVSDAFFDKHMDDMGMEIAFKKDGKVEKKTAPPGYSNYVGNEKYGQWRSDNSGNSFWAFYGRYAFMSSMFNMMTYPYYRSHYNNYYGSYYRSGRPYYGPRNSSGAYAYGTSSARNKSRSTARWNSRSNSFKSNVRSKAKRSASTSKRSRSRSRYSGSRSRSRSGGYGK